MRHHYISVAVFGIAFGIATAVTILVIGRAMMPQQVAAAAVPVQQPVQVQPAVMPVNVGYADPWAHRHWHYHWHWDTHDFSERIRAQVMSELADAINDIDVDTDDDDDDVAPVAPTAPIVTQTVVPVVRK
ncbi:MAG: hypothetical protein QM831_45245 [Kofleriaceae bacterium]